MGSQANNREVNVVRAVKRQRIPMAFNKVLLLAT
jgi:hypothetical protein